MIAHLALASRLVQAADRTGRFQTPLSWETLATRPLRDAATIGLGIDEELKAMQRFADFVWGLLTGYTGGWIRTGRRGRSQVAGSHLIEGHGSQYPGIQPTQPERRRQVSSGFVDPWGEEGLGPINWLTGQGVGGDFGGMGMELGGIGDLGDLFEFNSLDFGNTLG